MAMQWVDPASPDRNEWFPVGIDEDEITACVDIASDLLTRLTGYLVHPAGSVCEEYMGTPQIMRLTPSYRPIIDLVSVTMTHDCDEAAETDVTDRFCVFAGSVWVKGMRPQPISNFRLCSSGGETIRMCYSFGSTLSPTAERMAWHYASQLYFSAHPEAGECQLPERVTSVNREGVSWTIIDPQQYLDNGRTGLPGVDQYLAAINPSKGKRPAAVYLPEAPPGVPL